MTPTLTDLRARRRRVNVRKRERTDAERLDWLQKYGVMAYFVPDEITNTQCSVEPIFDAQAQHPDDADIRADIDAAMDAEDEPTCP